MTGLLILGIFVLLGFATLIVLKVRWSRQAAHKWAAFAADHNAPKQ